MIKILRWFTIFMLAVLLFWFFKGYFYSPDLYVRFKQNVSIETAEGTLAGYKNISFSCQETKRYDKVVSCQVKIYTNPVQYKTLREQIESNPLVFHARILDEHMEKGPEGEGFEY